VPVTRLTRRYAFRAAHVLAREDWSPERNRAVYGRCANPKGHGHGYGLEVTVGGEVDEASGMLLPVGRLDVLVAERVTARLDRALLNRDVPEFRSEVPTAENIARWIWRQLEGRLTPAALDRVRLIETPRNSVVYSGNGA
jgi:6-pyruvoyltetrahydropterin/6-carboxytetrahydropterin synthase